MTTKAKTAPKNNKVKPDTTNGKPTPPASSKASEAAKWAAIKWWAWTLGTLEEIIRDANSLAKELRRDDTPLEDLFDPAGLEHFAGRLGDISTHLSNNQPVPSGMVHPLCD